MENIENAILVWAWDDAPKRFKDLSPHEGDEDWVALLPPSWNGVVPLWMEDGGRFAVCDLSVHPQEDGSAVCIAAHA
jgi:hypothetical protein